MSAGDLCYVLVAVVIGVGIGYCADRLFSAFEGKKDGREDR